MKNQNAGRSGRRLRVFSGRFREIWIVVLGSCALAVSMTWPAALRPASTIPQDTQDPMYFVWQLAWLGHSLRTDPLHMWTTNAFSGARDSLAYTDVMLGYAPFALAINGFHGALVVYNILFILAAALAFAGAYALARVLGSNWQGALVCGAAFAYAPWRLAHERHLNVLSVGGITLSLALLAYGNGWRLDGNGEGRPRRPGFVLAGWLVAAWQLSLGFAQGLSFSWLLVIICGIAAVRAVVDRQRTRDVRIIAANIAGVGVYALVGRLLIVPYLRVVKDFPTAQRTEGMVNFHSPPVRGLFTAPAGSLWWGTGQEAFRATLRSPIEQTVLPGFVVISLALVGLFLSSWTPRRRAVLFAAVVAVALLALGTNAPKQGAYSFMFLFNDVPGWSGTRTPGRLILWVSLCLGLLAAGFVTRLETLTQQRTAQQKTSQQRRAIWAILLVPAVLVCLEGIGMVAHPRAPDPPAALSQVPDPVLVLPISRIGDYQVMAWSANGWPKLANGGSGFDPPTQIAFRESVESFPDARSVELLRAQHVRTVLLLRSQTPGTVWQDAAQRPLTGLNVVRRTQGDVVIFDL